MKYWISSALFIILVFFVFIYLFSVAPPEKGVLHIQKPVNLPQAVHPEKEKALFYFGYVGCETQCIPRMKEIATLYKTYGKDDLNVFFINLDSASNTDDALNFAKQYDPSFIGVSLPRKDLFQLTRVFNAYFSHSLDNPDEIDHSLFLYEIRKDSNGNHFLNNIYTTTPYDIYAIIDELNEE